MKRSLFASALFALAFVAATPAAHSQLALGDVQLLGFNTKFNKPNQFSFVLWTDVAANTQLHFTDSGFFSDGTLRDTESTVTWTAPSGGVTAGSVIVWTAGVSDPNLSGSLSLTEGTDQIFTGSVAFPTAADTTAPGSAYGGTLLHGLQIGSGWDATATSDITSALPSSLSGATSNFVAGNTNAGEYVGSRTGLSLSQFRAAVDDPANWNFTNGANVDLASPASSAAFGVVIPEPSTLVPLGALMGFALLAHRRRLRR